jgi:hypothetical protein
VKFSSGMTAAATVIFITAIPALLVSGSGFSENSAQNAQKKPLVELINFSYATLDEKGRHQEVLGKFGYHFADYDGVRELFFRLKEGGLTQTLSCKNASFLKEKITLNDAISYDRGDGSKMQTQNAVYMKAEKTLQAHGGFVIDSRQATVRGDSISYNLANNTVSAQTVKTTIRTDK